MTGDTPNPRLTDEIDENLRRVFQEMQQPDLPDRFTSLLDKLREQDSKPSEQEDDS